MRSTYACPQCKRIQGSSTPIGNTHQQKNKGDQRVQKTGHHVTDCSVEYTHINKHTEFSLQTSWFSCKKHLSLNMKNVSLNNVLTHLLDSWMRAMAIRILFRRKMTVRRMTASATDMIITIAEKRTQTHSGTTYYTHQSVTCRHNINL